METYKEINRGLTLNNQDLRIKINKLAQEKNYLNKCLLEEQAAHERTKNCIIKIVSQSFNAIINEIAPNYNKENNSSVTLTPSNLSKTVAESPLPTLVNGLQSPLQNENHSQRNITVRRKPQKLQNNNKLSPEITSNTNTPYHQIFRDHELKNSETTIITKTNIDNSSIQEQLVLTNDPAENSNDESEITSETSIDNSFTEEHMVVDNDTSSNSTCHSSNLPSLQFECHTIYEQSSNIESELENKSVSEYDTLGLNENTICNAPCSTPQIKLSKQQKILEDIMERETVVRVERLKLEKSVYENKTNCIISTGLKKDPVGNNKTKSKRKATPDSIDKIISERPKRKAAASVNYTSYFDD